MKLFSQEVKDNQELQKVLQEHQEVQEQYKVAVILYAFDSEGRIIFQRRGPGCSDERMKLESIGGKVQADDPDFRSALRREITEEVGEEADISIDEFVVSTYAKTFDEKRGKEQAWVYLAYKGTLKSGDLQITEPEKNLGYERYKNGELDEAELSKGARELYQFIKEKYNFQ